MTDTLHQEPKRDQFKTESPIRAFTTWTVQGLYALGKGFRPSLAHLVPYLHAMESKEGWQLVQVLEAGTQTPSFIFRQSRVIPDEVLIDRLRGDDGFKQSIRDLLNDEEPYVRNREGFEEAGRKIDQAREMSADLDGFGELAVPTPTYPIMPEIAEKPAARTMAARMDQHDYGDMQPEDEPLGFLYDVIPPAEAIGGQPPISAIGDDPINPKHYGGTACAEIGELLTANSYQVLKYNWRLGEKDSPCVEIGKSLWYLERELALISEGNTFLPGDDRLPDHTFFDARLKDRSGHTINVARALISWNRYGNPETLKSLRKLLQRELDSYDGCKERGSGLAI